MIIRFDHLTYVCNIAHLEDTLSKFAKLGYKEQFREEGVPNIAPKKPYLRFPNEAHSLYFLEKENAIPVEVISYELTSQEEQVADYKRDGYSFSYYTQDVESLKTLFESVGFKRVDENTFNAKGVLDKNDTFVIINKSEKSSHNLDNEGFTCPTLFVDSYLKTKSKVEEIGFICTDASPIVINGRDLKIFFVVGRHKEVLELISNK